jgi:hypothetical protein
MRHLSTGAGKQAATTLVLYIGDLEAELSAFGRYVGQVRETPPQTSFRWLLFVPQHTAVICSVDA